MKQAGLASAPASVELTGRERAAMAGLTGELCGACGQADHPGFLRAAAGLGHQLSAGLAAATVPVPLAAGDVLRVDDYRMVHGRAPFRPRYDGTYRWLRKVTVTPDLRRPARPRHISVKGASTDADGIHLWRRPGGQRGPDHLSQRRRTGA